MPFSDVRRKVCPHPEIPALCELYDRITDCRVVIRTLNDLSKEESLQAVNKKIEKSKELWGTKLKELLERTKIELSKVEFSKTQRSISKG